MLVAGFTFVRNSVKFDYPVVESIKSVLDSCDSFYVLVGNSCDGTLEQIKSIASDKIKIFHSVWNENLKLNGAVLADETNKAMDLIPDKYDWLFYIQADEVVHENYLLGIKDAMKQHLNNKNVDGLLFKYLHFYGSFNYIGTNRQWYRKEIRIIRNDKNIRSYKDAQGFRKNNLTLKLNVKEINACVYHYGWMRNPIAFFDKTLEINKFYKKEKDYEKFKKKFKDRYLGSFDFTKADVVEEFKGSHPKVMAERIRNMYPHIKLDTSKTNFSDIKSYLLFLFEKITKHRLFEYKNYIKV